MIETLSLLSKVLVDIKSGNLIDYSFQYYSVIIVNAGLIAACYFKNPVIYVWFLFGILPLLDNYVKLDAQNPTPNQQKVLKSQRKFKVPLLLEIALDWVFLIIGIHHIMYTEQSLLYKGAVLISIATIMGGSINLSHEVNHKSTKIEKVIGTLNLSKNLYMHFFIEHNYGHHRKVATPEDPATSQYNQTLGEFLPKTIYGGFVSSWEIENERCLEAYGSKYSIYNKMIWFTASYILIPTFVCFFFGWKVMILHLVIALGSVLELESINYLEHYGLTRKKNPDGTYENVTIHHSWNAPHRVSNYILFKLQRHSDHHENSKKPYQTLCSYDESPLLPSGYTVMLLAAQSSSLWFDTMNPLVDVYRKGEKPSKELLETSQNKILRFVFIVNIVFIGLSILQHFLKV